MQVAAIKCTFCWQIVTFLVLSTYEVFLHTGAFNCLFYLLIMPKISILK